jgi:hypothetical protein
MEVRRSKDKGSCRRQYTSNKVLTVTEYRQYLTGSKSLVRKGETPTNNLDLR